MKSVALLLALALLPSSIWAKPSEEINLAGGELGMTRDDLLALAKSRRTLLTGPSKGIMSADTMILVQEFVVNKDKQLVPLRGATRQCFMLLNARVIAIEVWFSDKYAYHKYLKKLTELGYSKKGEDKYVGQLKTGEFAGEEVEVQIGTTPISGRRKKILYTIQARCYAVLGKGITLEKIQAAMTRQMPRKDDW